MGKNCLQHNQFSPKRTELQNSSKAIKGSDNRKRVLGKTPSSLWDPFQSHSQFFLVEYTRPRCEDHVLTYHQSSKASTSMVGGRGALLGVGVLPQASGLLGCPTPSTSPTAARQGPHSREMGIQCLPTPPGLSPKLAPPILCSHCQVHPFLCPWPLGSPSPPPAHTSVVNPALARHPTGTTLLYQKTPDSISRSAMSVLYHMLPTTLSFQAESLRPER